MCSEACSLQVPRLLQPECHISVNMYVPLHIVTSFRPYMRVRKLNGHKLGGQTSILCMGKYFLFTSMVFCSGVHPSSCRLITDVSLVEIKVSDREVDHHLRIMFGLTVVGLSLHFTIFATTAVPLCYIFGTSPQFSS